MRYKHLFFDLDRTLWDFDRNSVLAIKELLHAFQHEAILDHDEFILRYKKINEHYWSLYRQGKIEKSELRTIRFGKTFESFGVTNQKLAKDFGEGYVSISPKKTGLVEGTIDLLEYLKMKDYQMHIITNGFEEVQHIKLHHSGLTPYFKEVIISEKIGFKKPHPLVFEHALNTASAEASLSLMIGDDLQADVIGAKMAGIDQAFFNPSGMNHQEEISFELKHLSELKDIL